MNANELADWVEQQSSFGWSGDFGKFLIDIATMLRQQQAEIERLTMLCECMTTECNKRGNEIEALKQIIDANNLSQNIGQFVKPANEPVAWMYEKSNGASKLSFVKEKMLWEDMLEIPLYTHPVKELTDEEMTELPSFDKPKTLQEYPIVDGMKWGRAYIVTREKMTGPWAHFKQGINLYVGFGEDNNVVGMWRIK